MPDFNALADLVQKMLAEQSAKMFVLENAIQQLWITTLTNTADPEGTAEALERSMLDFFAAAMGGGDEFSHHAVSQNASFWSAVRKGVAGGATVLP